MVSFGDGVYCLELNQFFMCRFPFDVKNPVGYALAVVIQFVCMINNNLTVLCVLVIVIAPCLILISTTNDIKYGLDVLNINARANESDFKITQQFNQIVRFHSTAKQLSDLILLFLKASGL